MKYNIDLAEARRTLGLDETANADLEYKVAEKITELREERITSISQ